MSIYSACKSGNVKEVERHIENGGQPYKFLNVAAEHDRLKVCRLLVKNGADPNDGLLSAVNRGHTNIIKFLIGSGADFVYVGSDPILLYAARRAILNNDLKVVECLLECGADVEVRGLDGKNIWDILGNRAEVLFRSKK